MTFIKSKIHLWLIILVFLIVLISISDFLFKQQTPEVLIAKKLSVHVNAISMFNQHVNGYFHSSIVEIKNKNRFFLVMSNDNFKNIVIKEMPNKKAMYYFFDTNSNLPNFNGYGVIALINTHRTPLKIELLDEKSKPVLTHNTIGNVAVVTSIQVSKVDFDQQKLRILSKFNDDLTPSYLIK